MLNYNRIMKNLIILALCSPLFILAQQESLTYDQTQDIKFAEQYKNNTLIDLATDNKGVYLLEIETNDGVINKKLILQ